MTRRKSTNRPAKNNLAIRKEMELLAEVRGMILEARKGVARAVDSGMTMLYWNVGRRIRQDILKEKRAEYGGQIVAALGRQLEREFGRGFGEKKPSAHDPVRGSFLR